MVFSKIYLTESLLPDEGHSEANPSKRIVGQESGKGYGAILGDLCLWRPQFVLNCSVL